MGAALRELATESRVSSLVDGAAIVVDTSGPMDGMPKEVDIFGAGALLESPGLTDAKLCFLCACLLTNEWAPRGIQGWNTKGGCSVRLRSPAQCLRPICNGGATQFPRNAHSPRGTCSGVMKKGRLCANADVYAHAHGCFSMVMACISVLVASHVPLS